MARVAFGQVVRTGACPTCGGQGRVPETPCAECGGEGGPSGRAPGRSRCRRGSSPASGSGSPGAGHAGETGGAVRGPLRAGRGRGRRALRAPRPGSGHRRRAARDPGDARRHGDRADARRRARGRGPGGGPARRAGGRCGAWGCRPCAARRGATSTWCWTSTCPADLSKEQRELAERLDEALGPRARAATAARACAAALAPGAAGDPARRSLPAGARRAGARRPGGAGARRGRGGARATATSSTRSTARRASCRRSRTSRRSPATGWWRSPRPRSPTTGRTVGRTSTGPSTSAGVCGCGPRGRRRARERSTSWSTPARRSAPAPTRPPGCAWSCCWSWPMRGDARGALADWGTGSGVLAIAAAKLGFGPIVACDHEPAALEAAGANAPCERGRARAAPRQPAPAAAAPGADRRRQPHRADPARDLAAPRASARAADLLRAPRRGGRGRTARVRRARPERAAEPVRGRLGRNLIRGGVDRLSARRGRTIRA